MVVWSYENERKGWPGRVLSVWTHTEQILLGKDMTRKSKDRKKGADPHRARYHSSVMDVENLHSGQEFKELHP